VLGARSVVRSRGLAAFFIFLQSVIELTERDRASWSRGLPCKFAQRKFRKKKNLGLTRTGGLQKTVTHAFWRTLFKFLSIPRATIL